MISIINEGRRSYLTGDTYAIRDQIRAIGAHWDAERKAWWTAKRDAAEQLIAKLNGTTSAGQQNGGNKTPRDGLDSVVAGRAEYKGKTYYLAGRVDRGFLRPVSTKDGLKVLLYFRDGSSQFWAACAEVQATKTYDRPQTIRDLQKFAAARRAETERAEQAAAAARKAAQRTPEQIATASAEAEAAIVRLAAEHGVTLIEPHKTAAYDRHAKGGVQVGDVTGPRKDGTYWLVTSVADPLYQSTADCETAEDMGHFGLTPGWITCYDAVQIVEPAAVAAARAATAVAKDAEAAAYRAALAPAAEYRTRHGASYGGTITLDGEQMVEPGVRGSTAALAWEQIAEHITARAKTGSIAGQVMDQDTLYRALLPDGRPVYREDHYRGFGDDLRTTFHLPADVYEQVIRAEVRAAGITREMAEKWLAQYRGCVGTELYEAALIIDTRIGVSS